MKAASGISAHKIQIEHLNDPIGISYLRPEIEWIPLGAREQTAFRVVEKDRSGRVLSDSGKISSSSTSYQPKPEKKSRDVIAVEIQLWDEEDRPGEIRSAAYELGLTKPEDFQAQWINPEPTGRRARGASYLRKRFSLANTEHARLYMTAHGLYRVTVNGKAVTDQLLTPGYTQYNKRLQVQSYDVSSALKAGENEILVQLSDGIWRGPLGYMRFKNSFGKTLALLAQLEVNGQMVCCSDGSWEASQHGPITAEDTMCYEHYDARREPPDRWHGVKVENFGYANLIGCDAPPVKAHECFHPSVLTTPRGETVLDFGQNLAGFVSFRLQARAGDRIRLTHGETLDENGNFTVENFQNAIPFLKLKQEIVYICKEGLNEYRHTTGYFGFRYVKLETKVPWKPEDFTAHAVYSDMEQLSFVRTGNADVNRLFQNSVWSMKSNFVDIPTDCPHREKSGYSGDIQVFSNTALYLMDCYAVLQKWLLDQASTQFENGAVKQISPDNPKLGGSDGGSAWCDSLEIVPFNMFRRYGSLRLLERLYEPIKRWEDFCLTRAKEVRKGNESIPREIAENLVDTGFHWGEWCEPDSTNKLDHQHTKDGYNTDVATAYLSYGTHILSEIADILGKKEDAAHYRAESEKAKNAYRRMFTRDGVIESKRQCQYIRPIILGLLNSEEERQSAADALNELVIKKAYHLNTGFLTTFELCRVLTDYGHSDTAYSLLLQDSRPSWLYAVKKGATTIPESWNFITDDGKVHDSFNHYSYGSISSWLIDRAAGIRVENGQILIQPYPDPRLGSMDCSYLSPLGRIRSAWRYEGDRVLYEIDIPCNAQAALLLPGREKQILGPGQYRF